MIKQKDIAERLGVSVGLVSSVLSGSYKKKRISESIAEKVIATAKEMGYKPNQSARILRTGKSNLIGLLVADISNAYWGRIAKCIESEASRLGYQLIFSTTDEDTSKFVDLTHTFFSRQVDGIIAVPVAGSGNEIEKLNNDTPVVFIDRFVESLPNVSFCTDNFRGATELTNLLIVKGYEKIAFFAYDLDISPYKERIRGFNAAIEDSDVEGEVFEVGYGSEADIQLSLGKAIRKAIKSGFDSFLFSNDGLGTKGLIIMKDFGINIPVDVGVVSFDNPLAFEISDPSITCYEQPFRLIAEAVVDHLVKRIENPKLVSDCEPVMLYEGKLIQRKSC